MRWSCAAPALTLMALSTTGTACFDVHTVDAGPAVLDDFEDGDLTPSLRPFGAWSCDVYQPPDVRLDCALTEGFQSAAGLSAAFEITDPSDGDQQHGSVQIATIADTPIDLTGSSAITFDVRLTNSASFPARAQTNLQLLCSTAIGENGATLADFVVIQTFPFAAEWSSLSLAMSNFGPAQWKPGALLGGTPACLRAVDGFLFTLDADLPDGETRTGVFSIDNVRVQR